MRIQQPITDNVTQRQNNTQAPQTTNNTNSTVNTGATTPTPQANFSRTQTTTAEVESFTRTTINTTTENHQEAEQARRVAPSRTYEMSTNETLDRVVEEANNRLTFADRRFEYSVHESTNTIVIRVFDTNTDEVVREFPPEARLDAATKIWDMLGIFVDNSV